MLVGELGARPDDVRRAGQRGELPAAGDVVVVEMRLDDVADPEIALAGEVEVDVDVAARVDDGGETGRVVRDHRGQVAEPVDRELAEEHRREGTTMPRRPGPLRGQAPV
jgi:hypothetical protein